MQLFTAWIAHPASTDRSLKKNLIDIELAIDQIAQAASSFEKSFPSSIAEY